MYLDILHNKKIYRLVTLVLFFLNWHVFPEFIFFEVNGRLFILSIFNKFDIFKSNFCQRCQFWVSVHFWPNKVTINDISVIHACDRFTEEAGPTAGFPRHRHFLGFFNVPVQAPTRGHPFYGYSEKPPHFNRLLRCALGYGWHILILNPWVPMGHLRKYSIEKTWYCIHGYLINWSLLQFWQEIKNKPIFKLYLIFFVFVFVFFFGGGGGVTSV